MIKSRRMRWAGHVVCIVRNAYEILVGKLEGNSPLGRPGHRWVWGCGFDSSGSEQGLLAGSCEHANSGES
jgi:hypothetical protein